MLEPRIYRAAFFPALIVLVLGMFSLEPRPRPAAQVLAADVLFDGRLAHAAARSLVREAPDRRAGTAGDARTARRVAGVLERRGFATQLDAFGVGDRRLVNVVARRPGASRRQLVVIAARDGAGAPDALASAADTGALLELSRVLAGRVTRKTLVLASVDGETLGSVGTRRFLDTATDSDRIDAVLVLSNAAAGRLHTPGLVAWSSDPSRASIGIVRTAADSLRREMGATPATESPLGQLARLAAPIGIGAQAPLLAQGVEAVRFSGSGELPPSTEAGVDRLDPQRMGEFGRAVFRTLTALDAGPLPRHGPSAHLIVAGQVLPGWVLSGLALALLLPPLVVTVDGLARARRRRLVSVSWMWCVLAGAVPFVLAVLAAKAIELLGEAPAADGAAFPPAHRPFDLAALPVLGVMAAVVGLTWLAGRHALKRSRPELGDGGSPAAGVAIAVVLALAALAVWALNPFAALLLAPAANAWTIAALGIERMRAFGPLLVALGLIAPAGVALYYGLRLGLDPLAGLWYVERLVTGGYVGLPAMLLACVWLGLFGALVTFVVARLSSPPPRAPARPALRGPGSYVGPGSLGGTRSALRR